MANQEHVDILRQGVEVWNKWREEHSDVIPDLRDVDLRNNDLRDADLNSAILRRADFSNTILIHTDLRDADFSYANINNADLSNATLRRADFREASLRGTTLYRADFSYAVLIHTDLRDADFSYANLSYANLKDADFSSAILSYADLRNANLRRANFTTAKVGWTTFGDLDLRIVKGLETIEHDGPSTIGIDTIYHSGGNIPESFLRGAGVPETFITYARSLVNNPIEYYTCFISYSSKDQAFAERLHNDLRGCGVRCWYAPEDMNIGDKIRPRIDESIKLYDKLLVILSENSVASDWVAYEVERALNKEPKGVPNVLYPIRLDDAVLTCDASWAQDIRETRHIGDFERWKDHDHYQEGFKRLLRALTTKQPTKET